ncbi:MAG TPA: MlaD family protein [Burkholderiaceae bacterium]|nr:MlaD family protein [Burkholderiaceae bacterium]
MPERPPTIDDAIDRPPTIAHLGFKAGLLLASLALLVVASIVFLLYARGAFEPTQRLVLVADDSEGVVVGMDLTFAGFPIGRVRAVELAEDGKARIQIDVPQKDAHWLRQSSVFTLVRGLVGGTYLRAYSGILTDPALPPDAVRPVLRGDSTEEIPKLVAAVKDLVTNLTALTASESDLVQTIANLKAASARLNGQRGVLGMLFGNERDAQRLVTTLERTNALLARLDGLTAKADAQLFGERGVMPEVRDTVVQVKSLLGEASASLKKVDGILNDAQAIAGNAKTATTDLGALRTEVEANLRKIEQMVNELNRKWPFAREVEIKLP